jgi:hypothetical protein
MEDHTTKAPHEVTDVIDVIGLWPSVADFAGDIGIARKHAQTMKDRKSIPAPYWAKVMAAAAARGIVGVTLERLAEIAEAEAERKRQPETAAAHP